MMSSSDSRAFPAMHSPVSSSREGPHYLCQTTVKQSLKKTGARELAQQLGALALAGDQSSPISGSSQHLQFQLQRTPCTFPRHLYTWHIHT